MGISIFQKRRAGFCAYFGIVLLSVSG
jgi:hypothetical protein